MRRNNGLLFFLGLASVGCGGPSTAAVVLPHADPVSFFITQYTHPRYHPQPAPEDNANCGPASLSMALKAFGRAPREVANDPEALMTKVRVAMTGSAEPGTWTYPSQMPNAAHRFGLEAAIVRGGASAVLAQLAIPGHMVVLNLNPTPAYDKSLAIPYDGGHFALATGLVGDRITLCDPLAPGPLTITRAQLETALHTPLGNGIAPFEGGVALWLPR